MSPIRFLRGFDMKIEDLRAAFSSGVPIEYKLHCQKRMLERNITRKDIANII